MVRGRPVEFDRNVALEEAMQLFWSRGYEATSLPELLERMGIARSSFYQSFGSKQDLFLEAVERYRDHLVAGLRASLADDPKVFDRIAILSGTVAPMAAAAKTAIAGLLAFDRQDP